MHEHRQHRAGECVPAGLQHSLPVPQRAAAGLERPEETPIVLSEVLPMGATGMAEISQTCSTWL